MNYNICIPIPVKSANISELKPILDKIENKNPNLIELRFDYINNIQNISLDFIKSLLNTINENIPVIFTFRAFSEGGKTKLSQKKRFKILKMFIDAKPEYIDIEMNSKQNLLQELIKLASQKGINIIFSYHNFERTLKCDEIINLIHNFNDSLIQNFPRNPELYQNDIYKIILTAQCFEDNLIPLKICKEFSNSDQKIISFCMGDLGLFSRIICVLTGSFLTYASLEEKTAPGQLSIEEMREIYSLI